MPSSLYISTKRIAFFGYTDTILFSFELRPFPLRVFTILIRKISPQTRNKKGCTHVLKLTRLIISIMMQRIQPIISMLKDNFPFIIFTYNYSLPNATFNL